VTEVSYLVRVTASWFVAGCLMDAHNNCVDAAPILRHYGFVGKSGLELSALCQRRGWQAEWLG
jgi:hypothetical protein